MNIKIDKIENRDETFSYSGLKDFQKRDDGDVRDVPRIPVRGARPRSRASLNNSY